MVVLLVVLVLLVLGAGGVFAYARYLESVMHTPDQVQRKALDAQLSTVKAGDPFNVLLLGGDMRQGDTAFRSDTMIIARIDPQRKKVWLLSIPRDTKVLIPGHGYDKINAAHTFGGAAGAVKAVKDLTGLPIDHYMEVDFLGFENAVNQLGGVWVDVPFAIEDKAAASQSVHQRAYKISAGYQKLDGEHALTFVRTRHTMASQDIGRMGNQQLFFRALADQLSKTTDVPKIVRVINAITPYVKTDMSLMDMMKTALAMKDAGSKSMYTATADGPWISPYIETDQAKLARLVADLKNGIPFEKDVASAGSAPATETPVIPSLIKVTVKNGAGVSGYGAQAAAILKTKGFRIGTVTNANQNVYKKTLVIYKKNIAAANAVAATLAPGTQVVQSRGMYAYKTEILVVVGKDWDVSKIPGATVKTP